MTIPYQSPAIRSIVWTGGIACGKSLALRKFSELHGDLEIFDADRCVHLLLANDAAVHAQLIEKFGKKAVTSEGADRKWLRENVFAEPASRKELEDILHPRVRKECLAQRENCLTHSQHTAFIADIPLYYDRQNPMVFDASVVIACSPGTQLRRLQCHRSLSPEMARSMIASQLPVLQKVAAADFALWNDGSESYLESQLHHLKALISQTT